VRLRAFDGYRMPAIGDRVTVKAGKAHDEMTADAVGTIVIIEGTALGVLFDGMDMIHKWYVADELDLVEDEGDGDAKTKAKKKPMPGMNMDGRDGHTKASGLKVLARDASGRATRAQVSHDEGIKVGDVKLTPEGYMIAEDVPVARTGVQEYSALELGVDASMKTIRLYRPPEEVFAAASMASLDRKPITYYHPEKGVDASNWKAVAVGRVETPARDGEFLRVGRFEVNDGSTVEAVAFGVKEVSCGYSFRLDMTPGTTAAGEAFDGVMRDIEHNHVAIVYRGRCGAGCALGDCACSGSPKRTHEPHNDNDTEEKTMKITVGGIEIELKDEYAALVKKDLADAAKVAADATERATKAETALAAQGEAMKKLATDHAAEVTGLKAQIQTPEQRKAEVAELTKVTADAKLVAADIATDDKTAAQIRIDTLVHVLAKDEARKPVVTAMLGGAEPAKADAAIVRGAFDAVVALRGAAPAAGDPEYDAKLRRAIGGKDGAASTGGSRVIDYNARRAPKTTGQASA